jgi:hypothetical protein
VTLQQLLEGLLGQIGLLFALLFVVWAGWRRLWVFGWYAQELLDRIDKLERRLDRAVGAAEGGTGLARKAIERDERRTEGTDD